MVDVSRLQVTVDLPERHYGRVIKGSDVSITISGDGDDPVVGKVTGVTPNASSETHTFPVIIDVPNPKGKLGGGMLVRATLSLDKKFNSLAVSKDAIVRQGTQTMVYTVAENKAVPVPVLIASTEGAMVAVTGDGLQLGMPVVVRGNERIYPGSPVMTAEGAPQAMRGSRE